MLIQRCLILSFIFTLSACGGSDEPQGPVITPYDLTQYQSRAITSSNLAGTWVAVGRGTHSYTSANDVEYVQPFAIKEYFVITQQGNTYYKKHCDYTGEYDYKTLSFNGNELVFSGNSFIGEVSNFSSITGTFNDTSEVPASYQNHYAASSYRTVIDYEMLKISDAVEPFATTLVQTDSISLSIPSYCFQQSNGYLTIGDQVKGHFNSVKSYYLELESWQETSDFAKFDANSYYQFYSDFIASLNIDLDIQVTDLNERLSFTAEGRDHSIAGSVVVELPQE
ncbi:hypothetical protein NBRC116188_09370 [Oceaniserpentilla sp. 4NH20-0058]|uniref:hypothetical protein n=1 Tax=Oceaniserpentilla sp. 4NH20-0058 TaxID=3127660 RepID=UPI0031029653